MSECKATLRVYVVNDPGCPYQSNPNMVGVYSDLEAAHRVASHNQDNEIQSFMLDCTCYDQSHKSTYEPVRKGWMFIGDEWRRLQPKSSS